MELPTAVAWVDADEGLKPTMRRCGGACSGTRTSFMTRLPAESFRRPMGELSQRPELDRFDDDRPSARALPLPFADAERLLPLRLRTDAPRALPLEPLRSMAAGMGRSRGGEIFEMRTVFGALGRLARAGRVEEDSESLAVEDDDAAGSGAATGETDSGD